MYKDDRTRYKKVWTLAPMAKDKEGGVWGNIPPGKRKTAYTGAKS